MSLIDGFKNYSIYNANYFYSLWIREIKCSATFYGFNMEYNNIAYSKQWIDRPINTTCQDKQKECLFKMV